MTAGDPWRELIDRGFSGMSRTALDSIERDLSPAGRSVLFVLLDAIERDKQWIAEKYKELAKDTEAHARELEARRIESIAEAMRRAKLFAYEDETGRKYTVSPAGAFEAPPPAPWAKP